MDVTITKFLPINNDCRSRKQTFNLPLLFIVLISSSLSFAFHELNARKLRFALLESKTQEKKLIKKEEEKNAKHSNMLLQPAQQSLADPF